MEKSTYLNSISGTHVVGWENRLPQSSPVFPSFDSGTIGSYLFIDIFYQSFSDDYNVFHLFVVIS